MMRRKIFMLSLAILAAGVSMGKKNVNKDPYPYGNPVIKHMYTADAAPHVMPDGRVWMVTSVDLDEGGGYSTMHSYHTFSSADMVNWVDHGEILHIDDVAKPEPEGEDWALWAPDMIYKDGLYYLYFPINVREMGAVKAKDSWTAVAVSDDLTKRFKIIQQRIPGTKGIDPAVFRDDDGRIYLYYGSRFMAELKDNMIEFDSKIKVLNIDSRRELNRDSSFMQMWTGKADNKKYNSPNYMEAPWMHKHNGKYYFNYHTFYGSDIKGNEDDPTRRKSNLDYSVGVSPWGPLEYGGTINYELGVGVELPDGSPVPWRTTQSNHGGVVEFHGKDYLFYHTSALSSWRQDRFKDEGTWTQRSVCIDELKYDENDNPLPVKQTLEGVAPVVVKQRFEINIAKELSGKGGVFIAKGVDFGSGYYYFDTTINPNIKSGTLEIRLDSAAGQLVGTCIVHGNTLKSRNGLIETAIRDAKGVQDIYFVWRGDQPLSQLIAPRIYAGSPMPIVANSKK